MENKGVTSILVLHDPTPAVQTTLFEGKRVPTTEILFSVSRDREPTTPDSESCSSVLFLRCLLLNL